MKNNWKMCLLICYFLSLPANQIGSIGNKLKLIGLYVIDVSILNENINKTFDKFKALEAIILKADFT